MTYLADQSGSALRRPYLADTPAAPMPEQPTEIPTGELSRGFSSGLHGSLANIQAFGASMADSMGFKDLAGSLKESALRRAQVAQDTGPFVGSTQQVHGLGDAGLYAAGAIGGAAGSILPTAAAGVLGGTAGAFGSLVPMSGGEVPMRHYQAQAAGQPVPDVDPRDLFGSALTQGVGQGALNMLPLMSIIGKGPLARGITAAGAAGTPAARFAMRAGATALGEGAQEGFEEYTNQQLMRNLYGQPMGAPTPEEAEAIRQNAIAGAVGMLPFGAGHGVAGALQDTGGAAMRFGKKGLEKGQELAGAAGESTPVQAAKEFAGDTADNFAGAFEVYRNTIDALTKPDVDVNAVSELYKHKQALEDAWPAIKEAFIKTGEGAKEAFDKATENVQNRLKDRTYQNRYESIHDRTRKLAGLAEFTPEDIGDVTTVQERHGKDVIDMGDRLKLIDDRDLSLEDEDALALLDKQGRDPLKAAQPAVRKAVSEAFLRAMEHDRGRDIDARLKLIREPLKGSKQSLSATTDDLLDKTLKEIGFVGHPLDVNLEQVEGRDASMAEEERRMAVERLRPKQGKAAAPQTNEELAKGTTFKKAKDVTLGQSDVSTAMWNMFGEDYRSVERVNHYIRQVGELVHHIAKSQGNPVEHKDIAEKLVQAATTPEAKLQLRELFAKAYDLTALNLNNKTERQQFVTALRELVSGKRVPITTALLNMAGPQADKATVNKALETYAQQENVLMNKRDFQRTDEQGRVHRLTMTPDQQTAFRTKMRADLAKVFGTENTAHAEALVRRMLGLDRAYTEPLTDRTSVDMENAPRGQHAARLEVDTDEEMARIAESGDEFATLGEVQEAAEQAGDEDRSQGMSEVPSHELWGHQVYDDETPLSPFESFRGFSGKQKRRLSGVEAFYEKTKGEQGALFTTPVTRRLDELSVEAMGRGEDFDREATAQKMMAAVLASEKEDAKAADDYLRSLNIDPEKRLAVVREKALALQKAAEGVPDGRTDDMKLAANTKVDTDPLLKEAAGGDPEIMAALQSVYWYKVHKELAKELTAAEFFRTFQYRLPGKKAGDTLRRQRIDYSVRDHLVALPETGAALTQGQLEVTLREQEDDGKWVSTQAALDLPGYLADRLDEENKTVSKEGIVNALAELIDHFTTPVTTAGDTFKIELSEKAKQALGVETGKLHRSLLVARLGDTEVRGRDIAGVPHEAPAVTPFTEGYTDADLSTRKKGVARVNADRGELQVGDQVVNIPQEVSKAAMKQGAIESNIVKLNAAQLASLLDRVFNALESRFPNDFDRGALPEGLVLAHRRNFQGDLQPLTAKDFTDFGLFTAPTNRQGRYARTMEYDMDPAKTAELNTRGYLDRLLGWLRQAQEEAGMSPEERAKMKRSEMKHERTATDTEIVDLQNAIQGEGQQLTRIRHAGNRPEMVKLIEAKIAEKTAKLERLKEQRNKELAKEVDRALATAQFDESRAKMAEREADRAYEMEDIAGGATMDDKNVGEFETRQALARKRALRRGEEVKEAPLNEKGSRGVAPPLKFQMVEKRGLKEPEGGEYGNPTEEMLEALKTTPFKGRTKNISELVGMIRSTAARLEKMRWGEPFDTGDLPAMPVKKKAELTYTEGNKAIKEVTLSAGEPDRIQTRLTDEEREPVYHTPKRPPKGMPQAEADRLRAEYEAKGLPVVTEAPPVDREAMQKLVASTSLTPKQVAARLEAMNPTTGDMYAVMQKLDAKSKLYYALDDLLGKIIDKEGDVKYSLSETQGPHSDEHVVAAMKQAIAASKKRLGKYHNLEFANIDAAGETHPDGRARVSLMAKNIFNVTGHENLHQFFRLLDKMGDEGARIKRIVLENYGRNVKVLEQAIELLVKDLPKERADRLLERFQNDPEERAAYLYELRVAGLIGPINPAVEGAFRKIYEWIRHALGFITDEERAANLVEAFDEGRLAEDLDNPAALARAMGQEKRVALAYRAVEAKVRPLAKAVGNLFTPGYDLLMETNIPELQQIAQHYGRLKPDATGRQGVYYERKKRAIGLSNEIGKVLEEHDSAARDAALAEVVAGTPTSDLAKKIDAFVRKYAFKGEIPFIPDRKLIEDQAEEFYGDTEITGPRKIDSVRRALSSVSEEVVLGSGSELPQVKFKSPEKRLKWIQTNTSQYLGEFINQIAGREAREAEFGKDAEKLKGLLEKLRSTGSEKDVAMFKRFVGGAEGWLGNDMAPWARSLQNAAITGLNIFHLPLSVFSALVDPIYIGARSGSIEETFKAYGLAMKSLVDTVANKEGKLSGEAAQFAEDIRLMEQAALAEPMADMFNSYHMDTATHKMNSFFFRWNFMQGVERAMFAASAMAAKRFLVRHAKGENEYSDHYLKELGLTKADIQTNKDGELLVFEHEGLTAKQSEKIQNAIHQFSFQSAARPTAMSNAIWMNDKTFALLAHMKPFIMAQSHGILSWLETQNKAGNYYPMFIAAGAVPIQIALGSVRNAITGDRSFAKDWIGATMQATAQAGLMGRWDFAYDVANNLYYGLGMGTGIEALGGPGFEDVLGLAKTMREGRKAA